MRQIIIPALLMTPPTKNTPALILGHALDFKSRESVINRRNPPFLKENCCDISCRSESNSPP